MHCTPAHRHSTVDAHALQRKGAPMHRHCNAQPMHKDCNAKGIWRGSLRASQDLYRPLRKDSWCVTPLQALLSDSQDLYRPLHASVFALQCRYMQVAQEALQVGVSRWTSGGCARQRQCNAKTPAACCNAKTLGACLQGKDSWCETVARHDCLPIARHD